MKIKNLRTAGIALISLMASSLLRAQAIEVQVQVTGLRNTQGRVLVAAHATRDSFPSQWDRATAKAEVSVSSATTSIALKLPASGRYAIMAVHDEDGDGRMSKNRLGLPREGYVTGNNPASLEFPRFDRSAVDLQNGAKLELRITYP